MNYEVQDAVLWLEATSGTDASYAVIFDRYRRLVFKRAYDRLRDVTEAEDVVAIVFMEAWRKRDSVRFVDGSLRPWLLVVTLNVCLNHDRASRRYRRLLAKLPPPDHEPDLSERTLAQIAASEAFQALRVAMKRYSESDQRVIELCLIDELPVSAAAIVLDMPVGTVKAKLSRTRKKLQVELERFAPASEVVDI
ncbi:sigma-70 family RNA polymerase sigma factor [Agromyces fucosus]|uniref:Sigma-70 family RNA polymerase sigma factor n=1 Tax=Agromyces fucosus TaxID=41985 RepID=A0A4Q2JMH0_9MICO|nr:sigma-70 family RNA polymerase sigma factor [Agromyces fucosus]RXZ49385.1 sigma-70 family RNA polymerase sigma factor [Agromyces fucosus]